VVRDDGHQTDEQGLLAKKTENPCRIWVGGLDSQINEKELADEFISFGELVEVKVRSTNRDTFAFVEFTSHTAAKRAIQDMDQAKVRGNRVKCNWASFKTSSNSARSSRPSGGRYQIWIGRLHDDTREDTIRRKFEKFGDIVSMQLRSTSKDVFCFIEYKNVRDCEDAIDSMNNREFDGSKIVVDWSKRNQDEIRRGSDRSPPRRRRRSRSYEVRRSRSRSRGRGPPPKGKYKCEIEGLPSEMTWMDLKNLARKMRGGDEITFARTFEQDRVPCGLLEFETRSAMESLMKDLDGKRINGHKVKITTI
jgi:RNA recognition motif-containing protein